MKKRRLLCYFLVVGMLVGLLNACQYAETEESAYSTADLKPDAAIQGEVIKPLKIAVFGQKVFTTRDGKVYEEIQGPSCKMGPHTVSYDFVYTELIEAFSKEADVPVEIIYGTNFYQEDLKADLYILDTIRNNSLLKWRGISPKNKILE